MEKTTPLDLRAINVLIVVSVGVEVATNCSKTALHAGVGIRIDVHVRIGAKKNNIWCAWCRREKH